MLWENERGCEYMMNTGILMMDGCTEEEAKKYLNNGSLVLEEDDFRQNFDNYMTEWSVEKDKRAEYRKMIDEKKPADDWSIVEHDGKTWYIMYVL